MSKNDYPDDIEEVLDAKLQEVLSYANSRLSKERTKVLLYYNRELPAPGPRGTSSYVLPAVYDAVNAMKAQLLETFSAGSEIVSFSALKPNDVERAQEATAYTRWMLHEKNDSHSIFHDVIDDALKARVGVVKVWWETASEESEEEFGPIDEMELAGLTSDPSIVELEAQEEPSEGDPEIGPDGMPMAPPPMFSGRLVRNNDKSQVRIENICPEEFFVDPAARSLKEAFHCQRTMMTKAEIEAMGFDTKKLKNKQPDADQLSTTDYEGYARNSRLDTGYSPNDGYVREEDMRYWLYEAYLPRMTSPDGRSVTYKVVRVTDVILDVEEVDRSPFLTFVPLRQAHTFEGENFAATVIPTQAASTLLVRAILDHTAMTSTPKWAVAKGGLINPRELLENRVGGIVNVNDPTSISALQMPQLNQYVFPTLDMLKANAEETTGISSLSQGLNKDAISNQNAQGLVNDLVDMSMTRQKVSARAFAYGFLAPLFVEIYRLILENDQGIGEHIVEISGQYVPVNPTTWIERKDATVDFDLSQSESYNSAQRFMATMTGFAGDQVLQSLITPQNRFNAAAKILKGIGVKDVNSFVTTPDRIPPPPPPQPDPAMVAQLQMQKQQLDIEQAQMQAAIQKQQQEFELQKMKLQLQISQFDLQKTTKLAEMHRKEFVSISDIDIQQRQMDLMEQQPAGPGLNAIDSPKPVI